MSANEIAGAFCISVILFFALDIICGETVQFQGTIADRIYTPEHTHVTHSRNGSRTTTDPETWELIVLTSDKAYKVRSESFLYYKANVGDKVRCKGRKGMFTGAFYFKRAIKIM